MTATQRKKLQKKLNEAAKKEGGRFFYRTIKQRIYREDSKNPFGSDFIEN